MRTRILLLIALLFAAARPAMAQSAPGPQDLWRQITLYRDAWGVPHVYADTPRALGFGFGYVQAEDHLERMLLAYRYATGRAAEVLGEPFAQTDAIAITLNHAGLARDAFGTLDGEMRDLLEGFALGINAFIADWPARAPEWADGVAPWEPLALLHCHLMSFAPWDLPGTPRPPAAAVTGNAWAVGPARSTSGETMLVINPHTDYEGPFQWYEAHLAAPGLHVYGATLYGLPVILQGHNEVLGWALTPNHPDNADVYREQRRFSVPPRNPNVIRQPGDDSPRPNPRLRTQPRYYFVRQGDTFEQRLVHVNDTERGPVVGMDGTGGHTWHAAGYREFGAMRQLLDMAMARDYASFRAVLARQQLPCFHVLYADRSGVIAYHYNARIADKPSFRLGAVKADGTPDNLPIDWTNPVPAWDSTYFWRGPVGIDALPSLLNPDTGFIQICGTPPWGVTTGLTFDHAAVPPWLVNDRDTYRARRVRQLLSLGVRSYADMQDMVFDTLVPFSLSAVPRLTEAAETGWAASAHPDTAPALEILRRWDGLAEPDRPGMTLFHLWWNAYRLATPDFATETDRMEAFLHGENPGPGLAALEQAARLMRNEYNRIDLPWGEVHRILRPPRDEPMPGALTGDPVWTASDTAYASGRFHARYGYGFAMAVSFGAIPQAHTVVPFGASDDPQSIHYDDQLALMLDRSLKPALFHPAQVQRHAVRAVGTMIPLRAPATEGTVTFSAARPVEARLFASAEPPAPLPEGLSLHTPCLEPRHAPEDATVALDFELRIPPELADDAVFPSLAVWGFSPAAGWHPLPMQQANPAARTLVAKGDGSTAYAVLGQGPGLALPPGNPDMQGAPVALYEAVETPESQEETLPSSSYETEGIGDELPVDDDETEPIAESGQGAVEIPESFAADPSRGPVAWGRVLELSHPLAAGRVRVIREEPISARLVLPAAPPDLPEGLVAFSPVVTIEASDPGAEAEVVVTLAVPADRCADADLPRLALHAWRAETGWTPAEGSALDEAARSFTAKDTACNTYAVLGPAECLVTLEGAEHDTGL